MGIFRFAKRGLALVASALLLATGLPSTPAQAVAATGPSAFVEGSDPAAFLYDPLNVNRIDITLPDESIRALAADSYANPISWQSGSVTFTSYKGQIGPMDIGMHLKGGWGSRRQLASCSVTCTYPVPGQKPGVKIKFNYGDANATQRFYGLKEITLNSMVQDQSMLHEVVDYRIARSAGIPAPRAGYMRMYVNGRDYGLHMILEPYEKEMYKRWFPQGTQHSYEGAYWQDIILSKYAQLQMHEGDPLQRNDLKNIATINTMDGQDWWAALNMFADVGELTKDWAFEHFIEHWDAYSWYIINNYHVHFNKDNIMTMHPWGIDNTLREAGVGYLSTVASNGNPVGIMFTKCLNYAPCKDLYRAAVAKIGARANAIDSVGFVDKVWTAISADVMNDPFSHGSGAAATKEEAKNFLRNRHLTSSFIQAATLKTIPRSSLYYEPPVNFSAGDTITPNKLNNSDQPITFLVMGDQSSPVCSVDSEGVITQIAPGTCVVSMSTAASTSFHASYEIAYVDLGKIPGQLNLTPPKSISLGAPAQITFTTNSTGDLTVTASPECSYADGTVTALVASGVCTLTIKIGKDSTHSSVTKEIKIPIAREVVANYLMSTDAEWTAKTKLPKGATLALINKATRVSGDCSVVGKSLKALAGTGVCTIKILAWNTAAQTFPARIFKIAMAPNPQTWVQKVAAPVTKKKIGTSKFTLVSAVDVTTTSDQEGFFGYLGNCVVIPQGRITYVQMTGSGVCKVTLVASSGYKVAGISRVWTFTK